MSKAVAASLLALLVVPFAHADPVPSPLAKVMAEIAAQTHDLETAISPNARWVAWSQSAPTDPKNPIVGSAVYLASATPPRIPEQISAAPLGDTDARRMVREKALAWSPDSRSLAFLSDTQKPGQFQLYVTQPGAHSARQLTTLNGFLASPAWSPDGKTIAVLYTENATRAAGPLEAVPHETGVIGQEILEQRIATVDVASGRIEQVSPADLYVYEYDWSPDGGSFAVTAARGSGDSQWYVAQLEVIDRSTGTVHPLLKTQMQISVPRWSPDGTQIAFLGGLMSDESIASGDLFVAAATGGSPRNLTPHGPGSTFWFTWLPKSADILTAEAINGASGLTRVDSRSGAMRVLWQGAETITGPAEFARGVSLAADGKTMALIRESFNEPPSLWLGQTGAWRPLLSTTPAAVPWWGKAESLRWTSDGLSVQGWLVPPAAVEPHRLYPMIVWPHGGPAWLNAPARADQLDYATVLASQGYYVFLPNPRGSAGFGETFKRANIKDMGGGDLRDILAGIRRVVATHRIDEGRIGISGWSYGGFMAMWAITQTEQFRAAVAGAGCADLLSYYGENGIDEWLIPYFGASVYDDPAVYAKSSPINFIKRVHTPTLLIVGDSDEESPPPQSYEYWHALKTLGVKTQLVIYPHEGHEFSDPAHVLDRMQRTVSWFDENMPSTAGSP